MSNKIYKTAKLHAALEALQADGIDTAHVYEGTGLTPEDLKDDELRVSAEQILRAFKNISDQNWDPYLPYRIGCRVHLSAYGLYGYALLCSTRYRETVDFATKYHYLAAPTVEMKFLFEPGAEGWELEPVAWDQVDPVFYAFLVCLQVGIHHTLHRDVMGPDFKSRLVSLRFGEATFYQLPADAADRVEFGAKRNMFHVSSEWIDKRLQLGNELTFKQIVQICDNEMSELDMHDGVAGSVRRVLLETVSFTTSMDAVAEQLGLTSRTLRRHLKQEGKTFSEIVDNTRSELALKFLRAAELSTEEIAYVLGFSETASFVRAFKRWTGKTPKTYRMKFDA